MTRVESHRFMNWTAMLRTISLLAILFQTSPIPSQSRDVTRRLDLAKRLKPIPDHLVVLTFDDAVSSHATFVAPLLKKLWIRWNFLRL